MNHPDTMLLLAQQRQRELHAEARTARLARASRGQRTERNGHAPATVPFRRRITIGATAMVVSFGVIVAAALAAI